MKNLIIHLFFSINVCFGQSSIVLKTETNLIVISYKSNSEFDLENPISWNGQLQQVKEKLILTGNAVSLISSDVGYLFGLYEVNYNERINLISDLFDKREFIRIYKLSNNKKDYDRSREQLFIISNTLNHLKKPISKSLLELTLKRPSKNEIIEKDSVIASYVLRKENIILENEKEIYNREQKGYEYYFKYKNNTDEIMVRNIVDSFSNDIKEPFECKIKFYINSDGDFIKMSVSESNSIYSYLFYSTKFEEKINEYLLRKNLKTKPITLHGRNFYSYCEFDYKHRPKIRK